MYPGLHAAVAGTGGEALNITCSSFATLSDLLGLGHRWRTECLVQRRNISNSEVEDNEECSYMNGSARSSGLRLFGTILCSGIMEAQSTSVAIGSSSLCTVGTTSNVWCLIRKSSSVVQGEYVHGMELQKCPLTCDLHGRSDGEGSLEGWKSEGKKCFRIEWEPAMQRKRGKAGMYCGDL